MMKKTRIVLPLMIALILTGFSFSASAQQKFAHINSNELLMQMPGVDSVQIKVEMYAEELQETYMSLITEFQRKSQEFEANQANLSEIVRQSRQRELESLRERIIEFQTMAEEDLMMHENRLLSPIIEKAQNAIQEVAEERGYSYVLDSGMGAVIHADPGDDIMPYVKEKLGIQ